MTSQTINNDNFMPKNSLSQIRQFSGIIGLLYNIEGYYQYDCDKQRVWTFDNVKQLICIWVKKQMLEKKIELCIGLSNIETLVYTYEGNIIEEQIVRIYGEIVSRHEKIPDDEILNTLFELFTYLKVSLNQHSVRFNYQGFKEHNSHRIS